MVGHTLCYSPCQYGTKLGSKSGSKCWKHWRLTVTGFVFSQSVSKSTVRVSTARSSCTIFICRFATCCWMAESFRRMMSLKAPHSPSMLSMYSQEEGNWNRCFSSKRWPLRYSCRRQNRYMWLKLQIWITSCHHNAENVVRNRLNKIMDISYLEWAQTNMIAQQLCREALKLKTTVQAGHRKTYLNLFFKLLDFAFQWLHIGDECHCIGCAGCVHWMLLQLLSWL